MHSYNGLSTFNQNAAFLKTSRENLLHGLSLLIAVSLFQLCEALDGTHNRR